MSSEGQVKWSPHIQVCCNLQADKSLATSLRSDGRLGYLLFSRIKAGCWTEHCAILCLSLLGSTGCSGILPRWSPVVPAMWAWHSVCRADGVSLQVVLPALYAHFEDVGCLSAGDHNQSCAEPLGWKSKKIQGRLERGDFKILIAPKVTVKVRLLMTV